MAPELLARGDAADVPGLRRRLLQWYRRHRRALPWRETADPYRIWVSEVMLQQTQVATAVSFYQTFLERFPTIASLARARESEVLAHWSGLGYYRRARHLREAARVVVREHSGDLPRDPHAFGRLPGVGRYTTGAVLSIAFGQPLAVLDGNVARVLSRLFALDAAVRDPKGAKALWQLATRLIPMRSPGDWNQALMELGAVVCLPRAPRCPECPVRDRCRARRLGLEERLPPAVARRRIEKEWRAAAVIERDGRILMARRSGRLLDGMWEPPGVQLASRTASAATGRTGPVARSTRRRLAAELARLGVQARLTPMRRTVRHRITHRDISVELWRGSLVEPLPSSSGLRFVDERTPRVAITALARKVFRL
jgi:A/G-specific adenine glycosylase